MGDFEVAISGGLWVATGAYSLIFFNPENSFMIYIVLFNGSIAHSVAQSCVWQAQLGPFLAHIV
jgi:hypothetical protein